MYIINTKFTSGQQQIMPVIVISMKMEWSGKQLFLEGVKDKGLKQHWDTEK